MSSCLRCNSFRVFLGNLRVLDRPRISLLGSAVHNKHVTNNFYTSYRSTNALSSVAKSHLKTGNLLEEYHEDLKSELCLPESEDIHDPHYPLHPVDNMYDHEEPETVTKGSLTAATKSKLKSVKNKSLEKLPEKKKEPKSKKDSVWRNVDQDLQEHVKSYIEMCFYINNIPKALSVLTHHHKDKLIRREVYDVALKESVRFRDWRLVKHILSLMKEREIPMSLHSFSHCFECLGRIEKNESNTSFYESISKILINKLNSSGFKAQSIFEHCKPSGDNLKFTELGVKLGSPEFIAIQSPLLQTYSSTLLQDLNDFTVDKQIESPAEGFVNAEELSKAANEQLSAELTGLVEVKSIACRESAGNSTRLKLLEEEWEKSITSALARELAVNKVQFMANDHSSLRSMHTYPYLCALSREDFVRLLMEEVRILSRTSEHYSPSISSLSRSLGTKIMLKFHIKKKQKNGVLNKVKSVYHSYCQSYLNPTQNDLFYNPRQHWQKHIDSHTEGPNIYLEDTIWPFSVVSSVGTFLYNIILNDLKIQTSQHSAKIPAFYAVFRTKGIKTRKEIKPHPSLIKFYMESNNRKLNFDASLIPMVSPPIPWSDHRNGGYLLSFAPLVRLPPYASQQKIRLQNTPYQQLYPALDALNFLGTIPWQINKQVLDLIILIFNRNGSKEFGIAQPPPDCPSLKIDPASSPAHKSSIIKERHAHRRLRAEMFSSWMDTLYRLSLANHYRDRTFWLPHNMDFRGRVYPCSALLTHLSSDMARSMLMFAQGKPLGKDGLNWLKVHLINLTGLKKRESVHDRLVFANQVMPDILDSANNPLKGKKWWVSSDEPWQTLAACIEVSKAIQCEDPSTYVCYLPIHQDGSCNGLQHYAALGRDQAGAASVNLAPAERPQDVYSNVAELVERERTKDEAEGNVIAKVLSGKISRKVVKQTVMTTVYGVTRYGARLQIAKQLKEDADIPPEMISTASIYLVGKTFLSLQAMFTSAREIQDWFTECAKLISTVGGNNVEWITPLGLPVVQPYSKNPSLEQPNGQPITLKQRNAFPPNFIHSLDSSHMMLTALYCQRKGITFASVHDCFWTHACTVDSMNKICREQFVSLHSQPILDDLSKFLLANYGFDKSGDMAKQKLNQVLVEVPKRGVFDLREVLKSVYFFS